MRSSVIPVLINYFQEISVIVKWHSKQSQESHVPGGGPQGAYIGNLEYTAQSNKNANIVEKDSRHTFFEDLTTLEKIYLLLVGMASHNLKSQIPKNGQQRSIRSKTVKLVKNGQKRSTTVKTVNTVKNGQYGQKRSKTNNNSQKRSIRSKTVKNGQKRSKTVNKS